MSAQDKETGAPSGAPPHGPYSANADLALSLIGEFDASKWAAAFVEIDPPTDRETMLGWFACAIMAGYDNKAKEIRESAQTLTLKIDTSAVQAAVDKFSSEFAQYQAQQRALVRELDVALNGEAGAAPQASLCDVVAQVRRQQSVQVLNLADGMRINFRAPDGRRSTLYMRYLLDEQDANGYDGNRGALVRSVMRDAIAAYPVAGEPVPSDLDADQQTAAQVQALGHQVHPDSALPSVPVGGCEDEGCPHFNTPHGHDPASVVRRLL